MKSSLSWKGDDRRVLPRVAGKGSLSAAIIDGHGQPRTVLRHAQVVNVSGGGLAFTSENAAAIGETVNIRIDESFVKTFSVRIVGAKQRGDGRSELRAQLITGSIPACLAYDW
jgi:PilZ domain